MRKVSVVPNRARSDFDIIHDVFASAAARAEEAGEEPATERQVMKLTTLAVKAGDDVDALEHMTEPTYTLDKARASKLIDEYEET